jgi:hypothetical protein
MNSVRAVFKSMPAPRPVVADLVHFPEVPDNNAGGGNPEFWTVRLYRDNFDSFSAEDRLVISNWINELIRNIRTFQPLFYLEVHERMPR